jgi:regulatory protein
VHQTPRPDDSQKALSVALRLLAYRARTESELRQRLLKRFLREEVEAAIQSVKERGYLNDAAYARSWRDRREESKPRAARRIRQELASKGVKSESIEKALEGYDDEENALRAARKLLHTLNGADFPTFARRMGNYLQRRGFGTALAWRVVRRLWEESGAGPPVGRDEGQSQHD